MSEEKTNTVSYVIGCYLRRCRVGGMSPKASKIVQDAVDDAQHLGYFNGFKPPQERIDQTHFVAAGTDHIWIDIVDKPWAQFYFTDETGEAHGPWLTLQEAQFQMEHYCQYVLGK